MAGVFFVERVVETKAAEVEVPASDIRDARDLAIMRMVLMEILPQYPDVLTAVQEEVRRRTWPGTGGP